LLALTSCATPASPRRRRAGNADYKYVIGPLDTINIVAGAA
jgi:hypothetical protein